MDDRPRYPGVKGVNVRPAIACPNCHELNAAVRESSQAVARCHRCGHNLYRLLDGERKNHNNGLSGSAGDTAGDDDEDQGDPIGLCSDDPADGGILDGFQEADTDSRGDRVWLIVAVLALTIVIVALIVRAFLI